MKKYKFKRMDFNKKIDIFKWYFPSKKLARKWASYLTRSNFEGIKWSVKK